MITYGDLFSFVIMLCAVITLAPSLWSSKALLFRLKLAGG